MKIKVWGSGIPEALWSEIRVSAARVACGVLLCGLLSPCANAFSLLGPYADWMTPELGYRTIGESGGPVPLGEEYRWNIPLVTYAFDQSFLEYFGSNGVAAVESAFGILNALPPASEMVLTNFPRYTVRENYLAENMSLMDLQSRTLCVLLQEIGLANPYENMFRLRRWDPILLTPRFASWNQYDESEWPAGTIPNIIQKYNFDPEALVATNVHNGEFFLTYVASMFHDPPTQVPEFALMPVFPMGPLAFRNSNIALLQGGEQYLAGKLTRSIDRDEIGGLRYLYSSNNINPEILPAGVRGSGSNASSYVDRALRPGIEKIQFARVDYDSLLGRVPVPITNRFIDTYIVEGSITNQHLERVISQPDIISDLYDPCSGTSPNRLGIRHTGANAWLKTSGNPEARGPGIIRPGIRLAYHRSSPEVSGMFLVEHLQWGSFEATAATPVVYPVDSPPADTNLQVRLKFWSYSPRRTQRLGGAGWTMPVAPGGTVQLQASTNLVDWHGVTVTNQGLPINWFWLHLYPSESLGPEAFPARFFRVKPD